VDDRVSRLYDPRHIAEFFDAYGEREWDRLLSTVHDRVNFEMHLRVLARHVHPGDRVLEAGAGAGRFTIELARLGASVTVTDISPEQIRLNEAQTRDAGAAEALTELRVTGDQVTRDVDPGGHFCHMFRWSEFETFLRDHRCELVEARGANFASVQNATALEGMWKSAPEQWEYLLDLEEDFTAEPGAIDSATHMIAVVRRD